MAAPLQHDMSVSLLLVHFCVQDGVVERRTSVTITADGTPVVRHEAQAGPAADALRHEAVVLDRVRRLGVVELLEAVDGVDGGAAMATRYVAGGTLVDLARDAAPAAVVAALARVATILADLHQHGVVHGRCAADHVVGRGPELVLCGFGGALLGDGPGSVDTRP